MSIQICASAAPISTKNVGIENAHRSVTYHPSVWGDYFLEYTSDLTDILTHEEQEHQILKEEVNKLLAATPDDFAHKLDLIDSIQRLGVGYHFETEIEKSLKYVHDTYHNESYGKQDNNLHTTALRFRLLRQQGYYVSCGVFDKFKDKQGRFDESALISNVQGLLSLYEAAQFRVHGEETLEEALTFSITHLNSLILQMKKLVRAYFEEAKWTYNGYVPTIEEYMEVALVSCAYMMLSTTSLVGMGELATKEAFDWISSEPLFVRASAIVCRLMDDMVGHGFEQKISIVECYMNQKSASKEEAFAEFQKQVMNAWKDINQECLRPTVPMAILMRVVNLARVINLLYKEEDGYTNSKTKLKEYVTSLLVQPIKISG
ncbi:Alpha-humulene/(-)-(E)-beta-caryophyllene synthase [Forsythia ovata]|uniref:Alpha-humulene/(-)-(E)-beta-caryophyllene synthase n=1 Tax=Forsythia ovata TaxID=205694 RepID=A0ABD1S671_9LAMI